MPRIIEYIGEPMEIDDYEDRHRPENQRLLRGIPIDPVQRETFDVTPNEERDQRELDDWWDRPFVVSYLDLPPGFKADWPTGRYDVMCLDGGAWDRSTVKGSYATLDEAVEAACVLAEKGPSIWDIVEIDGGAVLYTGTWVQCAEWLNTADVGAVSLRPVETE